MKTLTTVLGLLCLLGGPALAAEQTVSEHTATFTVRPGDLKMDKAKVVGEKIKRIINWRGNNPLNPSDPLYDPAAAGGGGGGGGVNLTNVCVGSVVAPPDGPAENWWASIELDASTGICQLRPDYSGNTLRVSDPPSDPPLIGGMVDAYPAGAWSFVAPSPVGGKLRFPADTIQTVRLRAPTGAVIDLQFQFALTGGGTGRTLNVLSTTPVPQ